MDHPSPSVVRSASTAIEALTFMSCVQNIERNISVRGDVGSIRVSLEEKSARANRDEVSTSPDAIAGCHLRYGLPKHRR